MTTPAASTWPRKRTTRRRRTRLPAAVPVVLALLAAVAIGPAPSASAGEPREAVVPGRPVDFEADVLPVFRRSCLACHNASRAEGDLVLETPARILAGGASGPAVLPGKGAESPLLRLAAHRDEPVMPPDANDRDAPRLTAAELGIVRAWIDSGAKGEVRGARPLVWQPPAADRQPVHAVAVSADGLVVAAGRADRIVLHETFSRSQARALVDPRLPADGLGRAGAAHVSAVESLAFSPDGTRLASGEFRTVKIWRRSAAEPSWRRGIEGTITAAAVAGRRAVCGCADGRVLVVDEDATAPQVLAGHVGRVTAIAVADDGSIVSGGADGTIRRFDPAAGRETGRLDAGGGVAAVVVLAGGTAMAAAGEDGSLRIWPLPAGPPAAAPSDLAPSDAAQPHANAGQQSAPAALAAAGSGVMRLAVADAAGRRLAAGSADGTVRLYDVAAVKEIGRAEAGGVVTGLAAAAAAGRLVVGTSTGRVTVLAVTPAGGLEIVSTSHAEPAATAVDIDPLEFARQRAGQVVATAREDLDLAVKDRDAERAASYTAILEVAKTAIDLAKKEAAIAAPAKTLATATEAAEKARAAVETAAEAEKTQAQAALKTADEMLTKARAAVDAAETERKRAAEEHAAAKLTVDRVGESVGRAVAAASRAQEIYDDAKHEEKAAVDAVALATRTRAATGERLERLAKRLVAAVPPGQVAGAAGSAADPAGFAIVPESLRGIEAAVRAVDEAEMAAMRSVMQAMTLVQQSEDGRKMAEETAGEADKALAAARNAAEQAAKEVDAARQKAGAAGSDDAGRLRAAELMVAEAKAATAQADVAAVERRLARVTAAREAAVAAATKAVPEAESIKAEADRRLADARRRFEEATAAVRQAGAAEGRAPLERQLALWERERAAAALVETRRPVVAVALVADGSEAVFADDAGVVRRVVAADGQPLGGIEPGPPAPVTLGVAADGTLLVVGPDAVGCWPRSHRWTLERQIGGPADATVFAGAVTALAFSPDGTLLAVGGGVPSRSGEISLWRTDTGERLGEMPQPPSDAVLGLEFSPAGDLLATASADRTVRVYDVATRSQLHGFEGHAQHVLGVAWRADGRLLASAAADGVVKSWDLRRGELRKSLPPLAGEATGVRYLGAGDTLVASAADGRVHSRTSDGGNAKSFADTGPCLHAVAVSRMGRVIVAGREDGVVQVWDAAGKPIATLPP